MGKAVVDTLNTLIAVCAEGGAGYASESDHTEDTGLAALLQVVSRRHSRLVSQLRAVVWQLGGVPAETAQPSIEWHGLHDALERHDCHQAVQEVDRTERQTLACYELALVDESVTPPLRELLHRHHSRLQDVIKLVHSFDN